MKKIIFLEIPSSYLNCDEFIAVVSKVEGKNKLLNTLDVALNFPDYFGHNWDALHDFLRDFSWIEKKGVVLVHIEIPKLSSEELKTYVEILFNVVKDWKDGEEHYFKVIFPKYAELLIQGIIEKINFAGPNLQSEA